MSFKGEKYFTEGTVCMESGERIQLACNVKAMNEYKGKKNEIIQLNPISTCANIVLFFDLVSFQVMETLHHERH